MDFIPILLMFTAYLLGSISGSMIVGKFKKVDIRTMGSGNAGGTNAFRTQGALFALGVITIDISKGWIAIHYIGTILSESLGIPSQDIFLLSLMCGFGSVLGHIYPLSLIHI